MAEYFGAFFQNIWSSQRSIFLYLRVFKAKDDIERGAGDKVLIFKMADREESNYYVVHR
jgi:hypothetical protein